MKYYFWNHAVDEEEQLLCMVWSKSDTLLRPSRFCYVRHGDLSLLFYLKLLFLVLYNISN